MWTSSSTTSGFSRRIAATASSTAARLGADVDQPLELGAHAGAKELVVVDDHDAGKLRRSSLLPSSRASARADRQRRPRSRRRGSSGPRRGRPHAPSCRRSTRARRGGRRARRRARSRARGRGRRPRSTSSLDLGVDADRARLGGVLGGVQQRLAGGAEHRLGALVELAVADHDDLDRDAVVVLDLLRRRAQRRGEARPSRRRRRRRRASREARAPGGARAPRPRAGRRRASASGSGSAARSRAGARRARRAPASGSARPARRRGCARAATGTARGSAPSATTTTTAVSAASRRPPRMWFEERKSSAAPITSSTPKTPR